MCEPRKDYLLNSDHEYSPRVCPRCDTEFCWSCCGGTNVHQGGKNDPDYMLCPSCGHDIYTEE